MMNRYRIMQFHTLLAGFLLPIAFLYIIGGALYTFDIKGHIKKQGYTLQLQQPFTPNLETLTKEVDQALHERNLPAPNAEPFLKRKYGAYVLEWSGLRYRVTLLPGKSAREAHLIFRERDLLTQVMRIHRAQAGESFKILALLLAAGLITVLVTGMYMVQSIPRLRRPFYVALTSGVVVVLLLVLI